MKTYYLKKITSDQEIAKKEGHYFNRNDFTLLIQGDADVYRLDEDGNKKLLLKIRKNVISSYITKKTFKALEVEAKKKHANRGAAAGLLTQRKLPKYVKGLVEKNKFRAKYYGHDNRVRKDDISNLSQSSIIGYYDQPDRNRYGTQKKRSTLKVPCRMTKFTKEKKTKWEATFSFFKRIDKLFSELCPDLYQNQLERAKLTPKYQILDTAFSTATINYNWQTALHRDKGDYEGGFGNLVVLEDRKSTRQDWTGGYLGFPQYGVCVEIREGDYLAMDVHQWHCNTPIIPNQKQENRKYPFARLSVVSYLRKNMIRCQEENKK